MTHDFTLIATIAAAFGLALAFGFLALHCKMPALVGYLVAGIIIGPNTPGFVADVEMAQQLAEIGVMLLMFGVGLHFSFEELLGVRRIAVPGAIAQIAVATALGAGVALLWGFSVGGALVFGLALSVASTVVLLRALDSQGVLETINGRIAVGWLIVEDIAMVVVLVLLPAFAGWLGGVPPGIEEVPAPLDEVAEPSLAMTVVVMLGRVGIFIALMLIVGRRLFPWLLWQVARLGSRELFTLCVIAAAIGVAYGSAQLFGVSFALGAFFAGMMMRESVLSRRAADESLPFRDAFSVLFFVSVGMLFDPAMLVTDPLSVLSVVAIIVFGKTLAAFLIVRAFHYPLTTALTVSASLAQIGEFSFILASLGVSLGLLPIEGHNLILAGALISIALNPVLFGLIEPVQRWVGKRERLARYMERPDPLAHLPEAARAEPLEGHVVIVGYGRVGERIGKALSESGIQIVVVEENRAIVERLRRRGVAAVSGDGGDAASLMEAQVSTARLLVVALPHALRSRQIIEIARALQPELAVVCRAHSDEESALLARERGAVVFMGEHELALGMTRYALEQLEARHK